MEADASRDVNFTTRYVSDLKEVKRWAIPVFVDEHPTLVYPTRYSVGPGPGFE